MALNEDTPEWKRSDYVVWDYPLENKFAAMYPAMMDVWISSKENSEDGPESESHLRVRFYRGSYDHKISDELRFSNRLGRSFAKK